MIDLLIVSLYARMLFAAAVLSSDDEANLGDLLFTLPAIFSLYAIWGWLVCQAYPNAASVGRNWLFAALTLLLSLGYAASRDTPSPLPERLDVLNGSALVVGLLAVVAYRLSSNRRRSSNEQLLAA